MSKRLLLADDSITIQKVIGITFANEDFELEIVDNGDAALDSARARRPDIILADVYMPGKNGYELCRAVKEDPGLRTVPVLLLTGTFEPFDEDKARQAGADDWIAKPFESQALIDKVAGLLERAVTADAVPAAEPQVETAAETPTESATDEEEILALGEEDIWVDEDDLEIVEDDFDLEEPFAESVADQPAEEQEAPTEEAVEVSAAADDDIWGAISFDEDDLLAEPQPEPEVVAAAEPAPTAPVEAAPAEAETLEEDPFAFAPEMPAGEAIPAPEPEGPAGAEAPAIAESDLGLDEEAIWEETEEEIFDLDDVDVIDEEDLLAESSLEEAVAGPESEPAAEESVVEPGPVFGEEEVAVPEQEVAESAAVASDDAFAWEETPAAGEGPVPIDLASMDGDDEADIVTAGEEAVAPAAAAPDSVERQVAALSEEQLEAIVEKVAGAVIERLAGTVLERIAWEVVPDLAESYIKEELRKIRDAV